MTFARHASQQEAKRNRRHPWRKVVKREYYTPEHSSYRNSRVKLHLECGHDVDRIASRGYPWQVRCLECPVEKGEA